MQYCVVIEEIVSEEFKIEADNVKEAIEIAEKLYKLGKIVLEPGNILSVEFKI